jgi:hypothetical protein
MPGTTLKMSKFHRSNVNKISYIVVDGEYQLKRSRVIGVEEMKGCGGHGVAQLVSQCAKDKLEVSILGVFK